MAYGLSNKCAKNLCKQTVLVQLIIENVVTFYSGTQCIVMKPFLTISSGWTSQCPTSFIR